MPTDVGILQGPFSDFHNSGFFTYVSLLDRHDICSWVGCTRIQGSLLLLLLLLLLLHLWSLLKGGRGLLLEWRTTSVVFRRFSPNTLVLLLLTIWQLMSSRRNEKSNGQIEPKSQRTPPPYIPESWSQISTGMLMVFFFVVFLGVLAKFVGPSRLNGQKEGKNDSTDANSQAQTCHEFGRFQCSWSESDAGMVHHHHHGHGLECQEACRKEGNDRDSYRIEH